MTGPLIGIAMFALLNTIPISGRSAGGGTPESLPTATQVVDRYIEAVGGRAAIESLATRVCIGRIINDLSWADPPHEVIPFAAYASAPGRVLVVEHKIDGTRCEGSDGEVTWIQDGTGVSLKEESFRSKTAWLLDPRNALRIYEYFPNLNVVSERAFEDRWVYVLESPDLDPAHYALSFDTETGLLVGIGYYWYLQDYREVDGIRLPHRVHTSRKGGSTTFVFDLVDHNLPLEETLFTVPAQGRAPGPGGG
jgi:hypothetical protein